MRMYDNSYLTNILPDSTVPRTRDARATASPSLLINQRVKGSFMNALGSFACIHGLCMYMRALRACVCVSACVYVRVIHFPSSCVSVRVVSVWGCVCGGG